MSKDKNTKEGAYLQYQKYLVTDSPKMAIKIPMIVANIMMKKHFIKELAIMDT